MHSCLQTMDICTKYIEYYFCHEPRKDKPEQEEEFFSKMYHLHRASRDPTYTQNSEEFVKNFTPLYIFPYGSGLLRSAPDAWYRLIPQVIQDDLRKFFLERMNNGIKKVFLYCADGKHVEIKLDETY